jgi:tetratricopeptide (TPR) repeat protein
MNRPLSDLGGPAAPNKAQPLPDASHSEVIQSQLERILGSAQFRDSLRLTQFLSFVVTTTLAGKTEFIKAYTIATQALRRDGDFDPQTNAIVRVEAGRLRRALARYYAQDGRDDTLIIDLPRGSYVPNFQSRCGVPLQQTVSKDSSIASASVASAARVQQLGCTVQQSHHVFNSIDLLFKDQQGQIAELSVVMRSVSQTLRQSRDLLKSSVQIGSDERPTMLEARDAAASDDAGDLSDAGSRDDTRLAPLLSQWQQPEQPRETPTPRQVRNLIASLTGRRRAHARIFKVAFAALAVFAILEMLFDIDHPLMGSPNHGLWYKLWPASNATAQQAPRGEGAPTIFVEPVASVGREIPELLQPKMIREHWIDALARYDDVTVVTDEPGAAGNGSADASQRPHPASSIYRLASTVRYNDAGATLVVRLIDTAGGSVAWSRQYEHPRKPDPTRTNGLIAPHVARSLLDPFGVIQARERVERAAADPMKETYRCILDANTYLRSFDPSQYRPVRNCLVSASERMPPAATVFADLAFVYLRNYRFGIADPPAEPTMLDNAYAAAARAVDIKPESAFAQYALGSVLLAKGDIARAKIASDKSYRLNPDDGAVAFGRATTLVMTGEIDAGLALLDRNAVKSPNSWIGYHLVKALGCYLKGDFKAAGAESRQIAKPFFPPGLALDTLIADKAGDRARAQQDIAMLYQFYPAWHDHFRASVGRYLPESAMADRVAADFKAAAADTEQ